MGFNSGFKGLKKISDGYIQSTPLYTFANIIGKGKGIPLQAWTGLEHSRRLRLLDF